MQKYIKNAKKSNGTRIVMSRQFDYLENSRAKLPFMKNSAFIGEIGRDRLMKRCIAINGRDEASFDQNSAIKSHPSDQRLRAEVSPRVVCEEACHLISCVGS